MTKPVVAIYTCALNEAKHAKRWMGEGAKEADVHLWLDTGSTDDTPKHAEREGITVHRAFIDPFRFDDARNAALALLPREVTHCLHLDADEVLAAGWREEFDANAAHQRFRYALRNSSDQGWGKVVRSNFHARTGFRWMHAIHEVVSGPPPTHMLETLTITHHPDWGKPRGQYIDIMRRTVAEEPHNARMRFYLLRELWQHGKWEEARVVGMQFLSMPEAAWDVERQEALRMLAKMDYHPEKWILKAISEQPARREPWVDLTRFYLAQGEAEMAKGTYAKAQSLTDDTMYTTDTTAWGDGFDDLGKRVADVGN